MCASQSAFLELVPRPSAQFTVTAPRSGGVGPMVGPMVGPGGASGGGWRVRWRVPLYIYSGARSEIFRYMCGKEAIFVCCASDFSALASSRTRF